MNRMIKFKELLGNRSVVKLLNFFVCFDSKEFSQRKLIEKNKLSKATMVKWLRYLKNLDILEMRRVGNSNLYTLNRDNCIVKELKVLRNLMDIVSLKDIAEKLNLEIYLFGSCARGEDNEKSDVDLLIFGDIKREDIVKDVEKLSERIGRKIKIQLFSLKEWSELYRKDPAFYERVEKDKIRIR